MNGFKALLLLVASCSQSLGQGASCTTEEQCGPGLACLRALCLRDAKEVWSPPGTPLPPGAVVHMRAEVVHPFVMHGAVELTVEGAASVGPAEFTMGNAPVLVTASELSQQTYFDVKPWELAVLADAWTGDGEVATQPDGRVFVFTPEETRELLDGVLVPTDVAYPGAHPVYWNGGFYGADGCRVRREGAIVLDCSGEARAALTATDTRLFVADGTQIRTVTRDMQVSAFAQVPARGVAAAGAFVFAFDDSRWWALHAETGEIAWQIRAPFTPVGLAPADADSVWAGANSGLYRLYLNGLGYVRFPAAGMPTRLAAYADGSLLLFDGAQPLLMRFAPRLN